MVIKIILVLIATALSSIAYRAGGAKGWNTKFRDWGCPLVLLGLVGAIIGLKWASWTMYALTFGLSWMALTTYWDTVFGYDNHYVHGLGCGLAGIPLIWAGVPVWIIIARIVICTIGMGLFSKLIDNDVKEELARGIFFIL